MEKSDRSDATRKNREWIKRKSITDNIPLFLLISVDNKTLFVIIHVAKRNERA
jgi:hypothetical protein